LDYLISEKLRYRQVHKITWQETSRSINTSIGDGGQVASTTCRPLSRIMTAHILTQTRIYYIYLVTADFFPNLHLTSHSLIAAFRLWLS